MASSAQAASAAIGEVYSGAMITRNDGLTDAEGVVADALCDAASAFAALPKQHPDESRDFCDAIHRLQDLLAMRIARRVYPKGWPDRSIPRPSPKAGASRENSSDGRTLPASCAGAWHRVTDDRRRWATRDAEDRRNSFADFDSRMEILECIATADTSDRVERVAKALYDAGGKSCLYRTTVGNGISFLTPTRTLEWDEANSGVRDANWRLARIVLAAVDGSGG